jgi:hypothetical protein
MLPLYMAKKSYEINLRGDDLELFREQAAKIREIALETKKLVKADPSNQEHRRKANIQHTISKFDPSFYCRFNRHGIDAFNDRCGDIELKCAHQKTMNSFIFHITGDLYHKSYIFASHDMDDERPTHLIWAMHSSTKIHNLLLDKKSEFLTRHTELQKRDTILVSQIEIVTCLNGDKHYQYDLEDGGEIITDFLI